MKKTVLIAMLALLVTGLLAACGDSGKAAKDVDLETFYNDTATSYEWEENYMIEFTDDMLDSYYPGLRDITTKQFVARMPMMSSVVNELVFLECESEEDAAKVAAIFQERVDSQAAGGAWYPESMEAWSHGTVSQQGNYVALIASAEHQDEITDSFNALFA